MMRRSRKKRFTRRRRSGFTRRAGNFGRFNSFRGRMAPELKRLDGQQLLSQSPANSQTIIVPSFNLIPNGAGVEERIGQKVMIKKLLVRCTVRFLAGNDADLAGRNYRYVIYQDTQCNGAAAIPADLFDNSISSVRSVQKFRNVSNSARFRFLVDKRFTLKPTAGAGSTINQMNANYKVIKHNINLADVIEFQGGSGSIAEIKSNNFGMFIVSETFAHLGAIGTPDEWDVSWRIRFSDT